MELLAPEECAKCGSVEKLIDGLCEKREYIERVANYLAVWTSETKTAGG